MRGEFQSIKRLNQEHYCQSVAEEIKMQALRFYIGWDSREDIAFQVARQSLERHASIPVEVIPIKVNELVDKGLYTRDIDPLASTEFTSTVGVGGNYFYWVAAIICLVLAKIVYTIKFIHPVWREIVKDEFKHP